MSNISFFHIASNNPKSTEVMIENVRKHHPNSYYFLGVDGSNDFSEIAKKYNCDYKNFEKVNGPPTQPFGYRVDKILEFLDRLYESCIHCNSNHIVMMEDDVLVVKPITVEESWEVAAHYISHGNTIHEGVLDMIERFSGKRPITNYYGAGGGTIFNVTTFIDNYEKVRKFFENQSDYIQDNLYPTFGWIDCFMVIYYYLCGKDYTTNPHLTDTHKHIAGYDYDGFVKQAPEEIQIINNYKKYYYER